MTLGDYLMGQAMEPQVKMVLGPFFISIPVIFKLLNIVLVMGPIIKLSFMLLGFF